MPDILSSSSGRMHVMIDGSLLVGHDGSVGTYTKELAMGLIQSGCSLTIAQPHPDLNAAGKEMRDSLPNLDWALSDHHFRPYDTYGGLLRWYHQEIPRLASRFMPDVYVSVYHHTPVRMPEGVARVTVIHDCCGLRGDCGYRPFGRAMLKHWSHLKTAALFADAIVPISAYTRQSFLSRFPSAAGRVSEPIYNSVTSAEIHSVDAGELLGRHELASNGFLLALAMPSKRKGVDVLLQGYARYRQLGGVRPLVFFGSGRIEAARWGLNGNALASIRVLGRIDDRLRDVLYTHATAFLFPSRCEGFGYPIVEAARRGCPVIAWRETTAPEILPEEQWMENLAADDLAMEIRAKEAWTEADRRTAGERLRRQVMRFSGSNSADAFMRVFEAIGKSHRT